MSQMSRHPSWSFCRLRRTAATTWCPTLSFANRKIILGSTPTLEDTSNVLRSYALSDQRVFEVPCPECGAFTEILWEHIEWEPDRPTTAAFRCPHCSGLIDERHKPA